MVQDFAYRVNIDWWVFVVAGFISLLIVMLTVSYQAIKLALANPVKNLRSEKDKWIWFRVLHSPALT
jgi:putative ABC transport system permease protein